VGAIWASPWSVARFVDGEDGSDAYDGRKPTQAFKTIQAAVTASTRGDVIYIRPQQYTVGTGFSRYEEDVAITVGGGGTASHCTNADISIIGCVNTINPTYGVRWSFATATNLTNDAPALHLENIGFFAESATQAILLRNNGATNTTRGSDGTTLYNCDVKGGKLQVTSGGDGLTIKNCKFYNAPDGITFTCSTNIGRRLTIKDCVFQGNNGAAVATSYIRILGSTSEVLIAGCYFDIIPTDTYYINATGTNLGMIAHCWFCDADMDTDNEIIQGGLKVVDCMDVAGHSATT
jgi:hypothetical protein